MAAMDSSVSIVKFYKRTRTARRRRAKNMQAAKVATRRQGYRHWPDYTTKKFEMTALGRKFIDDETLDGLIGSPYHSLQQAMRMLFGQPYEVGQKMNSPHEMMEVAKMFATNDRLLLFRAQRYWHYARKLENLAYIAET